MATQLERGHCYYTKHTPNHNDSSPPSLSLFLTHTLCCTLWYLYVAFIFVFLQSSLDDLMATVVQSDIHYIRCLKPNDTSTPGVFHAACVLRQLRACGTIETVDICRRGYPARCVFVHAKKKKKGVRVDACLHECVYACVITCACLHAWLSACMDEGVYFYVCGFAVICLSWTVFLRCCISSISSFGTWVCPIFFHYHHHHLSLNHEGQWGTTDDFTSRVLHLSLFSIALWDFANSRPVHSLIFFAIAKCYICA